MSFNPDMPAAARRHLEAADELPDQRYDVAGYLYGIAAECAIKAIMLECGLRPAGQHQDDPFYKHLPELKTLLRDAPLVRKDQVLRRFVNDSAFLHHWDISMRYCKASEIDRRWVETWHDQARAAVGCIGT
jgi:hypothetical protein